MNFELRLAILQSPHRTQIRVAAITGIREERLSRIVNGWATATDDERHRLCAALGRSAGDLFDANPRQLTA